MIMLEQIAGPTHVTNHNLAPRYKLAYRWAKAHLVGRVACLFGQHTFEVHKAVPIGVVITCSHCTFIKRAKLSVVY